MVVEFPPRYKRRQGAAVVSNQMASCSIAIGHLDFCLWSCMRHPVRDEGCALRPLGLSRASIGRDTAARYRSARVTVTAGSRGSRVDGETGEAVQPAGTGPPAADAGPPAAEPERASAAEPSWVARAVWRGIWQLIAAVLLTVAGLWSCDSQRAGPLPDPGAAAGVRAGASRDVAAPAAGWRRGSATGLLRGGILVLFVLLGALLAPALANGVNGAVRQLPSWIDKLNAFTQQHFNTTVVSASRSRGSTQAAGNATNYLRQHAGAVLGAVGSLLGRSSGCSRSGCSLSTSPPTAPRSVVRCGRGCRPSGSSGCCGRGGI